MECVPSAELEAAKGTLLSSWSPRSRIQLPKAYSPIYFSSYTESPGCLWAWDWRNDLSTRKLKPCWDRWAEYVAPMILHQRLIGSTGTSAPHCTGKGMARGLEWDLAQLEIKIRDFWKQGCSLSNCRCLLQNCWSQQENFIKEEKLDGREKEHACNLWTGRDEW